MFGDRGCHEKHCKFPVRTDPTLCAYSITAGLTNCLCKVSQSDFSRTCLKAAQSVSKHTQAYSAASKTLCHCRHDFVVVETIEFDEDEDDELPMLLTQRDVVLMNKAGPLEEDVAEPAAQTANGNAQTVEMSEEERAMVAEADAAAAPVTTAADRAPDGVDAQQAIDEQQLPAAAPPPQVTRIVACCCAPLMA